MTTAVEQKTKTAEQPAANAKQGAGADQKRAPRRPRSGGRRPNRTRRERVKPEYEQKILTIRRVTRVMAGGRRFSFSVTIAIGNKNGIVGVGIGKANDTSLAIQKAYNNAQRNLVKLNLTDSRSIPHEVNAKYSTARVVLMPNTGRGLVAGSAMRNVLELAGVTDTTAKILSRSKNQLNIARATVEALAPFAKPYKKTAQKKEATGEGNKKEGFKKADNKKETK